MNDELSAGLADLAGRLSPEQVSSWCAVLHRTPGPTEHVVVDLLNAYGGRSVSDIAHALVALWRQHAVDLAGAAIAIALRSAACVHEQAERRRPRLVISGPATDAVAVRLTSSVVLDIVRAATDRILLVSFAAHGVTDVVQELSDAADRGVVVDLILETTHEHGGRLRGGAGSGAFDILADRVAFWCWPGQNRGADRAALHAKVLVADSKVALVSSANFTDRGLGDNIEVGTLLPDIRLASRLDNHFRALMSPASRCFVPWHPDGPLGLSGNRP